MSTFKWDTYCLIKNSEFSSFWKSHYNDKRNYLYILGKGFDPRMCHSFSSFIKNTPKNCNMLIVDLNEGVDSPSKEILHLVSGNMFLLHKLFGNKYNEIVLDMWKGKQRVGSIKASQIFTDISDINKYTDIIVDISSMPRSIYFPIVRNLLLLLDSSNLKINLFITVSENTEMDLLIEEIGLDENASYIFGFDGKLELESQLSRPLIWIPILGENRAIHLDKAYKLIGNPDEICPLLPFPSRSPRRRDDLVLEYRKFLLDTLFIENQNIIYADEQNPFDVYRKIYKTLIYYNKSLLPLNGCNATICTFSSKLLSIGALLAAYEFNNSDLNIGIGIINIEPQEYNIKNGDEFSELKDNSECFAIWVAGEPYEN